MVKFISQSFRCDRRHSTSAPIPSIGPHLLQYVHPLVYLGGPRDQAVGSFKWTQKSRCSSAFTYRILISLNGTDIIHMNSLWGIESHVENQIKGWSKTLLPGQFPYRKPLPSKETDKFLCSETSDHFKLYETISLFQTPHYLKRRKRKHP